MNGASQFTIRSRKPASEAHLASRVVVLPLPSFSAFSVLFEKALVVVLLLIVLLGLLGQGNGG